MLRELGAEDAEAVAALIVGANPRRGIDADEVRSWLSHAAIDPEDIRVLEEDGAVVGTSTCCAGRSRTSTTSSESAAAITPGRCRFEAEAVAPRRIARTAALDGKRPQAGRR